MAEIYLKRSPARPEAAKFLRDHFGKFSDAWHAWQRVLELRQKRAAVTSRSIPLQDALERAKAERDKAFEAITMPAICGGLFREIRRTPGGFNIGRVMVRDLEKFVFSLVTDEILEKAAAAMIEPDDAQTVADQEKERAPIDAEIAKQRKIISAKIPPEMIGIGLDNFYKSEVWEAFKDWGNLQGQCDRPVDPFGQLCMSENPFYDAWDFLGLRVTDRADGIGGHRYTPASFDPAPFLVL